MTEKEVEKVVADIKALKIQGNTNIAKTIAKTLLDYTSTSRARTVSELIERLKRLGLELAYARTNEPLSVNAVAFMLRGIEECADKSEIRERFIDRIDNFFRYIDESYEIIRINAVNLLQGHRTFFTHCHSSLARDVLIRIYNLKNDIVVINDETRPRYQGRITAHKLAKAGVPLIHTVDSATASIFLDSRYPKPEIVLVGCDGISLTGDLVNKVGTLNVALAAREAGIPLYVVSQSMKIDMRSAQNSMDIEQRDPDEVWKARPDTIQILNPAFDYVPAKYITGGYITEKGLMHPEDFAMFSGI